jgi:hypothetical protein
MSGTEQLEPTEFVRKSIQLLVEEAPKAEVAGSPGSGYNKHAPGTRRERRDFKARVAPPPLIVSDGGLGLTQPIETPFSAVLATAAPPNGATTRAITPTPRRTPTRLIRSISSSKFQQAQELI